MIVLLYFYAPFDFVITQNGDIRNDSFKTIGDYIILMCYYMKLLKVSKIEIKAFIREFEKITDNYKQVVSPNIAALVIHPDLGSRMNVLKNFL